jgi:putative two-component system response regulator
LFHDIGKIGVPDSILLKEAKLTDDEYNEIKNHPSIGKHILSNATIFKDIIPIVYHHHEKYNGTGYPSRIAGEEIPLFARIAAVADTFDAMTSKRSYRNALPLDVVKAEIEKFSGTQFDPNIAKVFIDILDNHYDEILEIQNKYLA